MSGWHGDGGGDGKERSPRAWSSRPAPRRIARSARPEGWRRSRPRIELRSPL